MTYRFRRCALDAERRELLRNGEPVETQPLVLELLLYLVRNRNRVVPKDELMSALWADSTVTEGSLSRAISLARRAIGDTDRRNPLIRTHTRVGFRFIGEITGEPGEPRPQAARDASVPVQSSYAKAGSTHIAYQVLGDGPIDVVVVHGWTLSMQSIWQEPVVAEFHQRLSALCRLILFDKRGTGLSDRVKELPGLAQRMEDLTAVLDAAGSERAFVLGISEGAPMAILYAASHPERVRGLGVIGGFARMRTDVDQPFGWSEEAATRLERYIRSRWGEGASIRPALASQGHRPETTEWLARVEQMGASPGAALELWSMNQSIDVRDVVPILRTPCLVVHTDGDSVIDVEHGRQLARSIAGAQYVELHGVDHLPFYPPLAEPTLEAIAKWLIVDTQPASLQRLLATVLATDVPLDDGPLDHDRVEQVIAGHRARLAVTNAGETVFVFDGPARAICCGVALAELGRRTGSPIRVALHCSEIDLRPTISPNASANAPHRIDGAAVDWARRMLVAAAAHEVLISRTLRDLVPGSGIVVESRGELDGDDARETWPIFAARREA